MYVCVRVFVCVFCAYSNLKKTVQLAAGWLFQQERGNKKDFFDDSILGIEENFNQNKHSNYEAGGVDTLLSWREGNPFPSYTRDNSPTITLHELFCHLFPRRKIQRGESLPVEMKSEEMNGLKREFAVGQAVDACLGLDNEWFLFLPVNSFFQVCESFFL